MNTNQRAKREQKMCEEWNLKHAVGTPVRVLLDSGRTKDTVTRTAAQLLEGHSAVIWLEGIPGCYALRRVTALDGKLQP